VLPKEQQIFLLRALHTRDILGARKDRQPLWPHAVPVGIKEVGTVVEPFVSIKAVLSMAGEEVQCGGSGKELLARVLLVLIEGARLQKMRP
jgi:hypothetical protein